MNLCGKIESDLMTCLHRFGVHKRLTGIVALMSFILVSLSCAQPYLTNIYSLDGWSIVYGDSGTIAEICEIKTGKEAYGCAVPAEKTIYAPWENDYIVGHETKHITHGHYHY